MSSVMVDEELRSWDEGELVVGLISEWWLPSACCKSCWLSTEDEGDMINRREGEDEMRE